MRAKHIAAVGIIMTILAFMPVAASAQVTPVPPGSTLEQRLAQRKQERKIQLNDKDQKRLISLCKAAQEASRKIQRDTTTIIDKRKNTYRNIDAKLWIVNGRLKLAGKDSFNLEKTRAELAGKVAAFVDTAAGYQQTLDDIVVINCQADPIGFKALVETARLYYVQLQAQSTGIRSYIVDTIKPTLADYATQLQPKAGTQDGD